MTLRVVMGFGPQGADVVAVKALYAGFDGDEAEKVLLAPNEEFPRREYLVRPTPVKVRVDPSKEEIEEEAKRLADEAAAAEAAEKAAAEVLPEVDAQEAIDFLTAQRDQVTAERDALAAKVAELEAAQAAPPAVPAVPADAPAAPAAPVEEKKKK